MPLPIPRIKSVYLLYHCQTLTILIQARYLRLIFDLLDANTSTVVYEAASSLTALTTNPVAVKAAAAKFIELAIKEADNNVKLIVLDKVSQLRKNNEGILDDLTMEILRVLSSPDLDVRKKALELALDMVSSKNVEEVVMLLKKELAKTVDEQYEKVRHKLPLSDISNHYRTPNTDLYSSIPFTNVPSSSLKSPPVSSAH
jgi:vesicle coat complex subunit